MNYDHQPNSVVNEALLVKFVLSSKAGMKCDFSNIVQVINARNFSSEI
jgi:hypothetical protein